MKHRQLRSKTHQTKATWRSVHVSLVSQINSALGRGNPCYVGPDNPDERSLNIMQGRTTQGTSKWHTQIWIFPPTHQSSGLFQSSYHVLKIYTNARAQCHKIFHLMKTQKRRKMHKIINIFFTVFPASSLPACAGAVGAQQ